MAGAGGPVAGPGVDAVTGLRTAPDQVAAGPGEQPVTGRRRLGTRLLVAATLLWLVFVVLHLLLAGRWWPWFFFEGAPPLFFVVVPLLLFVFVPFARPVRLRLTALLALLVLVGAHLAGYGPGWRGAGTTGPGGTPVKVFAWNAQYWQMDDDRAAFYAFLRRQDADIYLLQEYMYWDKSRKQPIRIDDSAELRRQFPGYRLSVQGELVTLTHLPVVAPQAAPPQAPPGPGTAWFWNGAKAQRTDVRVGGRTVSFYNVHVPVPIALEGRPLSGRFFRSEEKQADWRTAEMVRLRTELAANPNPEVVAGDFNSSWMELAPLGAGTHLHSPPASLLPPRSWPISQFRFPRMWRLDWLFTSGGLAVPDYRFADARAFSDHAAQEIDLVVPSARKAVS